MKSGGEYRKCKAKTLFQIKGNPQLDKDSFVFGRYSTYPYFTRTVFNNGILGYVDYLDEAHLIKGNSLAVGMIGMQFFYMKHDFYAGQFTKTAFPKFDGFNEQVALWFISWLNKSSQRFQGVLVRDFESVFNDTELIVPYKNNAVAIDYIEEYIEEFENERIRELKSFLQKTGYEDCSLTKEEQEALLSIERAEKQMQKFAIVRTFNVTNTHNILKSDVVFGSGITPYVTASEGNNSIVSYISYNADMLEEGNSIMIGGKTLVITYQPRDFFSNDSHNLVLKVRDENGRNESAQLFMVAALYKTLGPKYSWGDSISNAKIQKDVVFLPVTDDGESIDYVFMETYINAIKKHYIANLKSEIKEYIADSQVKVEYSEGSIVEANLIENFSHDNSDYWMAAESFECYKWDRLDQSVCDFFGGDKTILVGCYKGKKHLEWILSHQMYNIRLGKTKGSMEANRKLFESTSILVLYELGKPNKLSAFRVTGHREIGKEELVAMGYPNENPRKSYMTFSFTPLDVDLSSLTDQHLIDRLIELNPDVIKGTPVFIEP